MLIPWKVDVAIDRKPYGNYCIMAATMAVFLLVRAFLTGQLGSLMTTVGRPLEAMMLDGWSLPGLPGSTWVHARFYHIAGNLLFLWVFGNAVCSKVGSLWYVFIYNVCGVLSGVAHLLLDGRPAIGASGAIAGIIGVYLILFPFHSITCFFLTTRFSVGGLWLILVWILYNIAGAAFNLYGAESNICFASHVGGFVAGLAFGIVLVTAKVVVRDNMDQAIFRGLNA
jgi:membrane associated rhomboid family serine protease